MAATRQSMERIHAYIRSSLDCISCVEQGMVWVVVSTIHCPFSLVDVAKPEDFQTTQNY